MLNRKLLLTLAVAAVLVGAPVTGFGQATITNQPVYFTFGNPVALPGTTLPAGQYEFRLSSNRGDREVVQVFNRTDGKLMATVLAIGASVPELQPVPEKAEVRFYESPARQPAPVRSWWYPGIRGGHEFIYGRTEAQKFAKLNPEGVLTSEGPAESGALSRMKDDSAGSAVAQAEEPAPYRAPASVEARNNTPTSAPARQPVAAQESAAGAQPPASEMAATSTSDREALPQTGSLFPIVATAGLIALFAGAALMIRRKPA